MSRPKGSKDTYKRVRGVYKRVKPRKAYKSLKNYIELEKRYNRLATIRKSIPKTSPQKKVYSLQMRNIRRKQALEYEVIAENQLVGKLCEKLGIGITMPYRRYINVMKEGTSWRKKRSC